MVFYVYFQFSLFMLTFSACVGFELVYTGAEKEFTCDHLMPGHTYRLRLQCSSAGGQSDVSSYWKNTSFDNNIKYGDSMSLAYFTSVYYHSCQD